jgi:hypothetical protein
MPLPLEEAAQTTTAVDRSWELLREIEAAIQAGDAKTLRSASEALKGCITSVLAHEALEAALMLENTLDLDQLDRAKDACRRLLDAINSLHQGR